MKTLLIISIIEVGIIILLILLIIFHKTRITLSEYKIEKRGNLLIEQEKIIQGLEKPVTLDYINKNINGYNICVEEKSGKKYILNSSIFEINNYNIPNFKNLFKIGDHSGWKRGSILIS